MLVGTRMIGRVVMVSCVLAWAAALQGVQPRYGSQMARASGEMSDFDPRVSPHAYDGTSARKVGVIVVDHGSKVEAANKRLEELCATFAATHARPSWVVKPAHMELASPSIADAFDACVADGCELVVCHPYFLTAGRHATQDVPRLFNEAAARHPGVQTTVTGTLGENVPLVLDIVQTAVQAAVDAEHAVDVPAFEDTFFGSIQAAMEQQQQQETAR